MATIKVTGGDLEAGHWNFTTRRRGCRMFRTTRQDWFRPAFVNFQREVVAMDEVDRLEYERLLREESWAFARGPIRAALRALTNAALGERNFDVAFRARLADGREFSAVVERRIWRRLRAAVDR